LKIDNFALTMFQTCPAKYFLRMREDWTSRRKSAALGFGGALHEGLAEWYRTGDKLKSLQAIDVAWPGNLPIDDWRTKEKCLQVMVDYMKTYPQESFKIVGYPDAPMIENTFTLPTGMFLQCKRCQDGDTSLPWEEECNSCGVARELIEYGGIFDGLVEFGPNMYVLEHKTTSMLGSPPHAYYFNQFRPNNQVTGYVWAGGILSGQPVGGAFINAIGINKSSPTKFARNITTRTVDDLKKWLINVRATCQQIQDCELRGIWPMYTGSCTMFGKCEFHDVHVLGTEREQQMWLEQQFVKQPWSYEHRDEVVNGAE
jgi:PD-(D/E)XK nuclease superfamily protein